MILGYSDFKEEWGLATRIEDSLEEFEIKAFFRYKSDIYRSEFIKYEKSVSWSTEDFEYRGTAVTGFSKSGIEKLRENKELVIPEVNSSGDRIKEIADSAFKIADFCDMRNPEIGISSVKLPSALEVIGREAFRYNSLTSVELPESLTTIKMLSFNGNIIEKLVIPDRVTVIEPGAFTLNNIVELKLPEGLETIPAAFANNRLKMVEIPSGVTRIDDLAFSDNEIIRVKLPDNLKYLSGFNNNRIQSIDIPKSVEKIGFKAFDSNEITSVKIPGNVKVIEERAFSNTWHDQYIANLEIEEGVESIEQYAFANNEIRDVYLPKSLVDIHPSSFHKNLGHGGIVHLHSPKHENWKDMKDSKYHVFNLKNQTCLEEKSKAATIEDLEVEEYKSYFVEKSRTKAKIATNIDYGYWSSEDFRYENTLQDSHKFCIEGVCPIEKHIEVVTLTGFSESGLKKLRDNKNLVLSGLEVAGKGVNYIAPNAFANMGIESLEVRSSVNSLVIGAGAFKSNSIARIAFSEGVRVIEPFAFYENRLKYVDFPGSLRQAGNQSFSKNRIVTFTISEGQESVCLDRWSFSENELEFVMIMKEVRKAHEEAFKGNRNHRVPIFLSDIDYRNNGLFMRSKHHRICKIPRK